MSKEQFEYICPQCRRRTVVKAADAEDEGVFCPRCEIDMKPFIRTADTVAAAANRPAASSTGTAAAAVKAPKKKATTTRAKTTKAVKEEAPVATTPDFGEFRCGCCAYTQHIPMGAEKPKGGWRCPTCFVRLEWVRA